MPDTLGKYELRTILGKGAMGTVYEGFDPIIARRVAIKTVKLPDAEDDEAQDELARFKREAQAAGRLSHPNIVGVFDYGETPELAYIVMEFVDGTTLKHILDKNERFEMPEIVRIMDGLMAGLQFSHDRGVVHRDIKPANIMVTNSGDVKIADFGIARIESSSMTQAGTMLGTPAYMSPEQFMGQTVDARTDFYSSGVMLYQLLTGEKPFEGGLTAIMHKVLNTEPPPPSKLSVTVTPAFDAVVARAMAKRPEDRFTSAKEFATALHEAQAGRTENNGRLSLASEDFSTDEATLVSPRRPATTPPANPAPLPSARPGAAPLLKEEKKGPNALVLGGAAVAVLAILGGGGFMLLGHHAPPLQQITTSTTVSAPTPSSAPSAPATTPAVVPPPTVTPAPMTPAQQEAAFTATLGSLPCTLLTADASGPQPIISGLAGAGAPHASLSGALQSLPDPAKITNNVRTIDGPYCNVFDSVRPYRALFADPSLMLGLSLAGGSNTLHDGELITVDEKMPHYGGYLETDYFSSDGSVLHLYPTPTDPLKHIAANGTKTLGDPSHGGANWQVSAPYGTDMILSIASSQRLFATPRPQEENASDYLSALRTALQSAASGGAKMAVSAIPVTTLPKTGQ